MKHQVAWLREARGGPKRLGRWPLLGVVCCLCGAEGLVAGDATVLNPLPRPVFSIDAGSPTVVDFGIGPQHILEVDGQGPPPAIKLPGGGLGLGPADDIDGLSDNHDNIGLSTTFVLLFSVGPNSNGLADPHVPISVTFPFNAKQQATLNQAAGDEFMALALFSRVPGPQPMGPLPNNNTLVGNQGDVGGVDHELKPDSSPDFDNLGLSKDNLDSLQHGLGTSPGPGEMSFIYFTLTSESPSNPANPGLRSGASIYLDTDPAAPGGEILFAQPSMLGLQVNDDIDSLVVFENGDGVFDPSTEQVLYSLAPGSPTLALGFSPADILTNHQGPGPGFPVLFASAQSLGLLASDNVDALDVWPCNNLSVCVQNFAVRVSSAGIPAVSGPMLLALAALLVIAAGVVLRSASRRSIHSTLKRSNP